MYIYVCIYRDRGRNETIYKFKNNNRLCRACIRVKLSKSLILAADIKHHSENWPQPWSPGSAAVAGQRALETTLCVEGAGCHSPAGRTAQTRHTDEAVRRGRKFSAAKISSFQDLVLH